LLLSAVTAAITAPAFAQGSAEEDTVVFTGSRIAKQDFVSNSPVVTVSEAQFELTGTVHTESLLNTLPQVVPGGASAVYGSDAVAGVVNFILKDEFEGVEASIGYEVTEQGDASIFSASVTVGGNFADGRFNAVFSMA